MSFDILLNGILGLMLTSAVLIAVPGPSVMFFIGQVMAAGRAHAVRGVLGNALGMALVAIVLSFGLGRLITHNDGVLVVLRLIGALVLLMIGLKYLRVDKSRGVANGQTVEHQAGSFLSGAIVGVTNPKALIMFGVLVPSFLAKGSESPVAVLMLYSLIPIVLGVVIDLTWVMAAHMISRSAFLKGAAIQWINRGGGLLIVMMAILLFWEAWDTMTA
ncbi:LysE family translocator [Salinicola endophyticus]|uniref:LysE family translocator n=1 Tax=Salinicola endophyticus TaxID=1949083 RepID=A0AB74U9D6_9GAMM